MSSVPPTGRRTLLKALAASVAVLATGQLTAATPAEAATDSWTTQTLEAFADTLIPGERRSSGDVAVAGAVSGPGAVQAGVMQVLTSPQLPLEPLLPGIAVLLNARASAYALTHLIWVSPLRPSFVGLSFKDRTALVSGLSDPGDLDRQVWQVLSLLVGMAFDTAAHLDTAQAVAQKHPGLAWLHFPAPDADGLWRFKDYSYGRPLADLHPATTTSGSPA